MSGFRMFLLTEFLPLTLVQARFSPPVIPGRPQGEAGIHSTASMVVRWIPGSRFARPGMTRG
jgi:hypothetical protein